MARPPLLLAIPLSISGVARLCMRSVYFIAGETSGDNHGADLLRSLRARDPQLQFCGRGGPKMREIAGGQFCDWVDQAAVVGLWEVVKRYFFFRREFHRTIHEIAALKPDALVLIDYPGFNLRLARALRGRIPELKIIYYISPQVWAWNQGRVSSMARSIDLMLCIFPFEPQFYRVGGLRAIFVGHPMIPVVPREIEQSAHESTQPDFCARPPAGQVGGRDRCLVAIFPGSREREVKKIFPIMYEAARILGRSHPNLRFEIAAASQSLARKIAESIDHDAEKFQTRVGNSRELMKQATVGMIASGTATLEAALSRLPFVLVYRVAWVTYFAARLVVKVRWLGMPNVLANREIVPEFIQHKARPGAIARSIARLLDDERARAMMLAEFDSISGELGTGQAGANAAEAILAELNAPGQVSHSEAAVSRKQTG